MNVCRIQITQIGLMFEYLNPIKRLFVLLRFTMTTQQLDHIRQWRDAEKQRIADLKTSIDLREVVAHDLGRPKVRGGGKGAWNWPCPFHDEQHGASLAVWPMTWKCFGACDLRGDVIFWVMRRQNMTYPQALRTLFGASNLTARPHRPAPTCERTASFRQPPSEDWQIAAREGIEAAQRTLFSSAGKAALDWLRKGRGLQRDTIIEARFGYNPDWRRLPYRDEDGRQLVMMPGIVMPWFSSGQLWNVRIRTRTGALAEALGIPADVGRDGKQSDKYMSLRGGNTAGLYWADNVIKGWPVLLTEGEFNALSIWQEGMDRVCPISLGSATTALNPQWYALLCTASALYAHYDRDEAGDKGRDKLASIAGGVQFVQLPPGVKDFNDLLTGGGWRGVRDWLDQTLGERVGVS